MTVMATKIKSIKSIDVGPTIEMPDWAELLWHPFFHFAEVDYAYKNGSDFLRQLIDATPFKGNRPLMTVFFEVRLTKPDAINSFVSHTKWHIDNLDGTLDSMDVNHLYTSKTNSMTEFVKDTIHLPEKLSFKELHAYMNSGVAIEGQDIEPFRIHTFDNHFHRAKVASGHEFRFMYRAQETGTSRTPSNHVSNHVGIYVGEEYKPNIEKRGKELIIHR